MDFHENPSSGSRFVPCGRTERERETDKYNETINSFFQLCDYANKHYK